MDVPVTAKLRRAEVSHVRRRYPVDSTQAGGMQACAVSRSASHLRNRGNGKRYGCENAVGNHRPCFRGNDAGYLQPYDRHDADAGGGEH